MLGSCGAGEELAREHGCRPKPILALLNFGYKYVVHQAATYLLAQCKYMNSTLIASVLFIKMLSLNFKGLQEVRDRERSSYPLCVHRSGSASLRGLSALMRALNSFFFLNTSEFTGWAGLAPSCHFSCTNAGAACDRKHGAENDSFCPTGGC